MNRFFIVIVTTLISINTYSLIALEAEIGYSNVDQDSSLQSSNGGVIRLGASIAFLPLLDMDFKYGFTTGKSKDTINNLNGENKSQSKHDTHFFGLGPSIKLLNWVRGGVGVLYQDSKHTLNESSTIDRVVKNNNLGYYMDLGLYRKIGLLGYSLTLTHQDAGDVDSRLIMAGIILSI